MLESFGLTAVFTKQLSTAHLAARRVARVTEVHRTVIKVFDGCDEMSLPVLANYQSIPLADRPTVGDWILLNDERSRIEKVLTRKSLVQRVVAGDKSEIQLIAANIDVLFVVTSCNEEFNESRLERYLTAAAEAGVSPVIVLTKLDLCGDGSEFVQRALRIQTGIPVVAINARNAETINTLNNWIEPGTTVALVGSSGVGKSTIVNTLMDADVAATGQIRQDDQKGRHTTSHRALYQMPNGGLLIDVPGIRELKVAESEHSLGEVFSEIDDLLSQCRFANCNHQTEPGCAVKLALARGELSQRRFDNYLKLVGENEYRGYSNPTPPANRNSSKQANKYASRKKSRRG